MKKGKGENVLMRRMTTQTVLAFSGNTCKLRMCLDGGETGSI